MQARSQGAPLRIGTILSVTGPAAFLGEDMRAGVEIAIEEINAVGGVGGGKVEWMFYDAASQTQKALDSTRRLLSQRPGSTSSSGGGSMSGIALAMAPMAEAAGVPFISTEGAMNIVQPVNERRFVFKSTVDDDQVLERFADWCAKNRLTRVAMLADTSGFGQSCGGADEARGRAREARRGLRGIQPDRHGHDGAAHPHQGHGCPGAAVAGR